ncbi:O-methyltransferase [Nonomuraea sediminis]|uniref:O-methyltransferase n=1 Tax=Nonomuraea sediminis TaxID=2835864 RepID=UPI001BDD7CCD|nr:class I SAM-dependent methyltransferase [Nonomuraea sediminis]
MNLVMAAEARAQAVDFPYSCDPEVGRLLATLAAQVPVGGSVLEIGTGVGAGLAWLVSGLLPRTDVTVTTIESDRERAALAAQGDWPAFVDLRVGDALELRGEGFDLIFADAAGGKHEGLDATIGMLRPRGVLVVDDMVPQPGVTWDPEFTDKQEAVRRRLLTDERLVAVELAHGSGVIMATRRP